MHKKAIEIKERILGSEVLYIRMDIFISAVVLHILMSQFCVLL